MVALGLGAVVLAVVLRPDCTRGTIAYGVTGAPGGGKVCYRGGALQQAGGRQRLSVELPGRGLLVTEGAPGDAPRGLALALYRPPRSPGIWYCGGPGEVEGDLVYTDQTRIEVGGLRPLEGGEGRIELGPDAVEGRLGDLSFEGGGLELRASGSGERYVELTYGHGANELYVLARASGELPEEGASVPLDEVLVLLAQGGGPTLAAVAGPDGGSLLHRRDGAHLIEVRGLGAPVACPSEGAAAGDVSVEMRISARR